MYTRLLYTMYSVTATLVSVCTRFCPRVHVHGHTFDANTRSPFLMRGSDSLDWDCGLSMST